MLYIFNVGGLDLQQEKMAEVKNSKSEKIEQVENV